MGKKSKNKKARETAAVQRLAAIRRGELPPDTPLGYSAYEGPNEDCQDEYTRDGALIIDVDDDLDVEEIGTDVLSPIPEDKERTITIDKERVINWLTERELGHPGATLDLMNPGDVYHVRSHKECEFIVNRIKRSSQESIDGFLIGFDNEGEGPGKDRRTNAVFQLKSRVEFLYPAHVFEEGPPIILRELFMIPNAIFIGKNIAKDVWEVANAIGIPAEEAEDIKVIDTDRMFNLAEALARGPDAIDEWLAGPSRGFFKEVSLKNFVQMVRPTKILDKAPSHRNHLADF